MGRPLHVGERPRRVANLTDEMTSGVIGLRLVLNTVRARVCYVAGYLGCGMSASRGR